MCMDASVAFINADMRSKMTFASLPGDYMFKFEMKGEKQTVIKTKPFTLTSPYETALNKSKDENPPFAPGCDELRDFSICSILARIVQKNHFNVDVTTLFSKPGFAGA